MHEITEFERAVGRRVQGIFGPHAFGRRYGDEDDEFKITVVEGPDCPQTGVTSYSTVGLSNFLQSAGANNVRVEIAGACGSNFADFAHVISSCYFEHVKNSTNIVYGALVKNIISQYNLSPTLKHVTFVAPFVWDGLSKAEIEGTVVYWLLALPISDEECEILEQNGIDALEKLFEQEQIDIYDLARSSVL